MINATWSCSEITIMHADSEINTDYTSSLSGKGSVNRPDYELHIVCPVLFCLTSHGHLVILVPLCQTSCPLRTVCLGSLSVHFAKSI